MVAHISATVLEILTSEVSKNGCILFFAGGPDGQNDLKLISGVKRTVFYHMPQNQFVKEKKFIFGGDLDFDIQGHPRSKVPYVIEFAYVINCNHRPICHRFRDIDL